LLRAQREQRRGVRALAAGQRAVEPGPAKASAEAEKERRPVAGKLIEESGGGHADQHATVRVGAA
jgi:hypothetical protein